MTNSGQDPEQKNPPEQDFREVTVRDKEVKHIYFEAFARGDRMPFPLMIALAKRPGTQLLKCCEADHVMGFVYLAYDEKLVFITFLAVDGRWRARGYGSALLREVQKEHPNKKIMLSIEPCEENAPNKEQRLRRKVFYLRNGYEETDHQIKLGGKWQEILITNGVFDAAELQSFFVKYSNGTMRPKIKKEGIPQV